MNHIDLKTKFRKQIDSDEHLKKLTDTVGFENAYLFCLLGAGIMTDSTFAKAKKNHCKEIK